MGQALYRKYRSRSLDDVVGQEHITSTLKNAIKSDKVSHAYLFTGPRGVGKTSVARILAHEINQLPYDDENIHLDIIEIDAASNNGVEDIRDLREKVSVTPTSARYKVYIIDEVHMLSKSAFNALLKTLEEPPAHAVFILATTESHKLPDTIISRTQRYSFHPIEPAKVVAHLKNIASQEQIIIDDKALELIARHGEGSFRDSISLLDQASARSSNIDINLVLDLLGLAPDEKVEAIISALASGDPASLIDLITKSLSAGQNTSQLASQLEANIKQKIITGELADKRWFDLVRQLLAVPSSNNPARFFEIILLEFAINPATNLEKPAPRPSNVTPASTSPAKTSTAEPVLETSTSAKPQPKAEAVKKPASKPTADGSDIWQQTLNVLKKQHNTLYAVARMARADIAEEGITLYFKHAFHQKRLSDAKNQTIIVDTLKEITGKNIALSCEVDVKEAKPAEPKEKIDDSSTDKNELSTISNIFGGGELID